MTSLITIRDNIKAFLIKYDKFIIPAAKFIGVFIVLLCYNHLMGYSDQASSGAVIFVVSLLSSFMPAGLIVLMLGLVGLVHMYAVGIDVALLYFAVFLLMYLLYMRFAPKYGWIVVVMPVLYMLHLHYLIPIVAGIFIGPAAIVPMAFGIVFYYFVDFVAQYKDLMTTASDSETIQGFSYVLDGLKGSKEMWITIIVFAVVLIVTYIIYRLSFKYSWFVAIVSGAVLNAILLLSLAVVLELDAPVVWIFIGCVLAGALAVVAQFFKGVLDYSRTENVQFEDDEYYYYVKAVPKIRVAEQDIKVQRISDQPEDKKEEKAEPVKKEAKDNKIHVRPVQVAQKAAEEKRIAETKRAMEEHKAKLAAREQAQKEAKAQRASRAKAGAASRRKQADSVAGAAAGAQTAATGKTGARQPGQTAGTARPTQARPQGAGMPDANRPKGGMRRQ